ncbi:MAG: hypothetical protein K0Q55_1267 [Verrucomicrobia bacterium]|jgi:hypothetical protein|nr:hypothetical protein [Verrucomicrobiota bacterium]
MKTVCEQAVLVFGTRLCAKSTSRSASFYFTPLGSFHVLRLDLLAQDAAAVHQQGPLPSGHISTCISYA